MDSTLTLIKTNIVIPIVEFAFVLALLLFLWGVVQYIININNPSGKKEGTLHMFWGLIGLAIMMSAFGIINFVWETVHPDGASNLPGAEIQKPDLINNQSL